jgi:hypothetical protein
MRNIFSSAALALAVAFTGLPVTGMTGMSGAASAQNLELELGQDGPRLRLRDDCDSDREDCRDRRDRGWERRQCTPERALDKAERMGLRRARIVDVGRRTIEVRGRNWDGDRVSVRFGRWDRRCPVFDRD